MALRNGAPAIKALPQPHTAVPSALHTALCTPAHSIRCCTARLTPGWRVHGRSEQRRCVCTICPPVASQHGAQRATMGMECVQKIFGALRISR